MSDSNSDVKPLIMKPSPQSLAMQNQASSSKSTNASSSSSMSRDGSYGSYASYEAYVDALGAWKSITSDGGPEPLAKEGIPGFHSLFTSTDRIRAHGWGQTKKQPSKPIEPVKVVAVFQGPEVETKQVVEMKNADESVEGAKGVKGSTFR
jgi:hypothetical protein